MAGEGTRYVRDVQLMSEDPDVLRTMRSGRALKTTGTGFGDFLKESGAAIYGTEHTEDDRQLARRALEKALQKGVPNPKEYARELFQRAKARKSAAHTRAISAAGEAIQAGAAELPQTVDLGRVPEQAAAIEKGHPWKRTREQARLELSKRVPKERARDVLGGKLTPEESTQLRALEEEEMVGAPIKEPGPWWDQKASAAQNVGNVALKTLGGALTIPGAILDAPARGIAAGTVAPEDADFAERLSRGWRAALNADDRQVALEIAKRTQKLDEELMAEARSMGGSEQDIKWNYEKLRKLRAPALHGSPVLQQELLVGGLSLATPMGWFGAAAKGIGRGVKALGEVPGIKQTIKPAVDLGEGAARALVKGYDLEKELGGAGKLGAYQELMAEGDRAKALADKAKSVAATLANLSQKSGKDQALVMAVQEGRAPIESLKGRLDIGQFNKLRDEFYEIKKSSGALNLLNEEGVIQAAKPLSNYVPHSELLSASQKELDSVAKAAGFRDAAQANQVLRGKRPAPPTADLSKLTKDQEKLLRWGRGLAKFDDIPEAARQNPALKAAYERANAPALQDAAKQWRAVALESPEKIEAAAELRGGAKALWRHGLVNFVKAGDPEGVANEIARLSREVPDVEWVALGRDADIQSETLNKILQVIGNEGQSTKGVKALIVPKSVADHFKTLIPLLSKDGAEAERKAFNAFSQFYKSTVRPLLNIARLKYTVARAPAFLFTNFIGAAGIGAVNNGLRSANPKLQAGALRSAWSAAFNGDPQAMSMAFRLGDGAKVPLGYLQKQMLDFGVVNQIRQHLIVDPSKPRSWAAKGAQGAQHLLEAQVSKLKLDKLGAVGDNYQKSVTFLGWMARHGRLDKNGQIPQGVIAEALDYTAKFAGNWNRLTNFEKRWARDVFMFYSWSRFVLPWYVRQVVKNPKRIQTLSRLAKVAESHYGSRAPITQAGIPEYLQGVGAFTAPNQPGKEGDLGHEHSMSLVESPYSTIGGILRQSLGEHVSPWYVLALTWMLAGQTEDGAPVVNPLPGPSDLGGPEGWRRWIFNPQSDVVWKHTPVVYSQPLMNLLRLSLDSGDMDTYTRLMLLRKMANDTGGLSELVRRAVGKEPTPGATQLPGIKTYSFDPQDVAARKKRKADEMFRRRLGVAEQEIR